MASMESGSFGKRSLPGYGVTMTPKEFLEFILDDSIPFESRAEVFDGMCTRANTEESLSFGGMDHIEVFPVLRAMLDMIREGVII